jgi:hypothetical protein
MNRRAFLAGLTAAASGLLLPERHFWFLDQTMVEPEPILFIEQFPNAAAFMERTAAFDSPSFSPTAFDQWLENYYYHELRMAQAREYQQAIEHHRIPWFD